MSFSIRKKGKLRPIGGTAPRVRMQLFPLAADRGTLERFVDRWFNSVFPPEVAHFRVTAPVVVCTILTYDDMSDEERWRTGLYSQNEIYFLVMLDRMKLVNGVPELVERGATTPFIFVDNAASALIGRDRFGYPKELCVFEQGTGVRGRVPWAADASPVITVKVWEPGEQESVQTPLIRVVRNLRAFDPGFDDATQRMLPPTPGEITRSDLLWWAQSILKEAADLATPVGARGAPSARDVGPVLGGELPVTVFNLRQMPHPAQPSQSLYRDLIRYEMKLSRVQNVRWFSEEGTTLARPLSLVIRRSATSPIVERLGLRVFARERRSNGREHEIWDVLHPVAPLYLQGDVIQGRTARLCWQHDDSGWDTPTAHYRRVPASVESAYPPYDDYVGGSSRIIVGPRPRSPIHDRKYLIIPARREVIEAYFAEKLPPGCPVQIRPRFQGDWVPVRVAIAQARPRNPARPGPLVWQDGRAMSFSIPVTYVHEGVEGRALYRLAELIENPLSLIIAGTIYSGVARQADLSRGRFDWFSSTQRTQQHLVAWTSIRRSRSNEVRFLDLPWLDVVSDVAPDGPQLHEALAATFAEELARHQPTIYLAGIPHPEVPSEWVQRRITLAEVGSEILDSPQPIAPGRAYYLRIRPSDNLDLVTEFALDKLEDVHFPSLETPDFARGSVDVIPAVGYVEHVEHTWTSRVRVLWRHAHSR